MHTKEEKMEAFGRLLDIIDELREKCPWDRKQTNESLRPNTIEETYELCDALMKNDNQEICKELGDVLMHVCFYAKFGDEKGEFDIKDVCDRLCDKLIYRHPHIYGDAVAELGTTEDKGERGQQDSTERCAQLTTYPYQSLSHTGQGTQRGIRLGRCLWGLAESERGDFGI